MNQDLPRELDGKFTLVIDAGTLEHIFNFPTAIRNCMRLLEVGGHLVVATPANNFMGHGFYQFSPELFYRVLAPENGFRVVRMYVCEVRRCGPWYELTDPAALKQRVELVNHVPTYLLVLAQKVSEEAPFAEPPQQSDYAQGRWQEGGGRNVRPRRKRRLRALVREVTPCWLTNLRAAISRSIKSPYTATYFKRADWRAPENSTR
jgi:SAM-dependent methyltransferase